MGAIREPEEQEDEEAGIRIGGPAGGFEGFMRTWKDVDSLSVKDELLQDFADPDFILRNIDLASSCCGHNPRVSQGYLRRKEVQRLVCSQCLFVAAVIPFLFEQMVDVNRKSKKLLLKTPLIGIIGAGGQLGSAIAQTFLDFGWKPFRLAIAGRGQRKLAKFQSLGVHLHEYDKLALLVRAVRLVIVAVAPQHARQVGSALCGVGTGSRLVLSTLTGVSDASLKQVLGAKHLLHTRVDMAQLQLVEVVMARGREQERGTDVGIGTLLVPATTKKNPYEELSRNFLLTDRVKGEGREKPSSVWEAVHARASRHLVPDGQTAQQVLGTLEAFCIEEGLGPEQARKASRGWLEEAQPSALTNQDHAQPSPSDEQEDFSPGGGETETSFFPATTTKPLGTPGHAQLRHDPGSLGRQARGSREYRSPALPLLSCGAAVVKFPAVPREFSPRQPGTTLRSSHSRESSRTAKKNDLANSAAGPNTPPLESSSVGDSPVRGHRGDPTVARADRTAAAGRESIGVREDRSSTAASWASAPSASMQSPRRSPRRRRKGASGNGEEEQMLWLPELDWPPHDLSDQADTCEEVLFSPYRDAFQSVLEEGG